MPDYDKSKIYKIVCNITGLTYYGSTLQPISKRMYGHRSDYKLNKGCKSELVLAGCDYNYSLVEEVPCENKEQLLRRERFWVENNECVNKQIPGRTRKEFYEQYYEANEEKIKEKKKQYYEATVDKFKQYYEANKEKIKERNKQYASEKIECEFCKSFLRKSSMTRHHKTKKCQKFQ